MRAGTKRIWVKLAVVVALALVLLGLLAPRETIDRSLTFNPAVLGDSPETWLEVSEQEFTDIRPGAAKRILWAGAKDVRSHYSIVYIHGFGASAEEIRPAPDELARALNANLFYTRLSGQGRAPAAMPEASVGDWLRDMAEAMAIGRQIGDKVIVIGTSMGGALVSLAASDPNLAHGMAGIALISPAYALPAPLGLGLDLPLARYWAPFVFGATQTVQAVNADHQRYWAMSIPTTALFSLATLMREVRRIDFSPVKIPLLVFYSPADQIIDPSAITPIVTTWGGPVQVEERYMQAGDDPYSHVIAGDVFSPGQTEEVVEILIQWAQGL